MSTGDDENQLLSPLTSKDKIITGEARNLQEAEKELVSKGILELPALDSDASNGKLVITELVKRYGNKNVVNNLSLTIY